MLQYSDSLCWSDLLEGRVLWDSVDLESLQLFDLLVSEEGGDIDGYLYLLLEGSGQNPTLAIVSLRDVFTVEMILDDSGCYLPVRLEWYEEDIAD